MSPRTARAVGLAIQASIGLRYETLPMLRLVH